MLNLVHLTIEQGENALNLINDFEKKNFLYGYAKRRLSSWICEESFNAQNLIEASKALATADYDLKQAWSYLKQLETVKGADVEQIMDLAKTEIVSAERSITLVHDYMSGIFE